MYKKIVKKVFPSVIAQAESEDEKEVVAYGLEVLMSNSVNLLVMLLIGLISNNLLETIIYLTCFCSIRVQAGGYHANSYLSCFLCTIFTYSFIVGINPYITMEYNMLLIIMAVISYVVTLGMAPILNGKRTFSMAEIKGAKKKVILILVAELLATVVLYHINFELYKFAIYAMITEGVFGGMGKIKYWKLNKKTILKNVMNLSVVVAVAAYGWPCLYAYYEPEIPKALKDKLENQ